MFCQRNFKTADYVLPNKLCAMEVFAMKISGRQIMFCQRYLKRADYVLPKKFCSDMMCLTWGIESKRGRWEKTGRSHEKDKWRKKPCLGRQKYIRSIKKDKWNKTFLLVGKNMKILFSFWSNHGTSAGFPLRHLSTQTKLFQLNDSVAVMTVRKKQQ